MDFLVFMAIVILTLCGIGLCVCFYFLIRNEYVYGIQVREIGNHNLNTESYDSMLYKHWYKWNY